MSTPSVTVDPGRPLPLTVDELTPEWFTAALQRDHPGVVVTAAKTTRIIWGTATKVFLTLTYADASAAAGLPAAVCVKGGFDEPVRAFGLGIAYEHEAGFFRDLAPALSLPLPRVLYAGVEDERQGIVIFEDLNSRGVTFGDPLVPWTADDAATGLEVLASLHGQTWGTPAGRYGWLELGATTARGPIELLLTPEQFGPLTAREAVPALHGALADPAAMLAGYRQLWAHDDAEETAVAHGDAHVGQTYVDADGTPAFLDWQGACATHWAHDVPYFVATALDVETRRASERDLVTHYTRALSAAGGPELSPDLAWEEYRRHTLHGFVWAITPELMQPIEIVGALSTRLVTAIEDHDPLDLLR